MPLALTETERHYAQIEKEDLAVTWACEKFRTYLLGLNSTIETDHKSLVEYEKPELFASMHHQISSSSVQFHILCGSCTKKTVIHSII